MASLASPRHGRLATTPKLLAVVLICCLVYALFLGYESGDVAWRTPGKAWKPVSSMYATIWHNELERDFGIKPRMRRKEGEAAAAPPKLNFSVVVGALKANGFNLVMSSVVWGHVEPEDGQLLLEGLSHVADVVCNIHGLQLSLVVDVGSAPIWVHTEFTKWQSVDSSGRKYPLMSMGHTSAVQRAYLFIAAIADHMTRMPGCLHSIQPNWNNEYEAKYTQEYDSFQDYSPAATEEYRRFFQASNSSLDFWNKRWATEFTEWAEVEPPKYWQGRQTADTTALFHDFLKFRDVLGSGVVLEACEMLTNKGIDCLLHIPEIYTVADPIYQASMFWRFARSPHVRYLVMDTNFMTSGGTEGNPLSGQFLVSVAKAYPEKFVYFEAAFERFGELTKEGIENSLQAGVDGLGYTNWLGKTKGAPRPPRGFFSGSLTCNENITTALLIPHEMAMCIRGLTGTGGLMDPVQEYVTGTYAQYAQKCGKGGVHVYGDMQYFGLHAHNYTKIITVQSPVLYKTTENTLAALLAASTAIKTSSVVPLSLHPETLNTMRPITPTIIDDLVLATNGSHAGLYDRMATGRTFRRTSIGPS